MIREQGGKPGGFLRNHRGIIWLTVGAVLASSIVLGYRAEGRWLVLTLAAIGALILARRPSLGVAGLLMVALLVPVEIDTGTDVKLNATFLALIGLLGFWLLGMALRGRVALEPSPVNRPLLLFVGAGLLSLLVGLVLWDVEVPRGNNFLLVQIAQWMIYALSALALLLSGNLVKREEDLRRLTFLFLFVGGMLAILRQVSVLDVWTAPITTAAFVRAPFWVLLTGLAGGQLLFNRRLTLPWRLFLLAVMGTVTYYAFVVQREGASNWVGVVVTGATLGWMRWPRQRWLFAGILAALLLTGILFPAVYQFAGGEDEWSVSGGSRIALVRRVLEDTISHNPVTGLGPAAYRAYGALRPLQYEHIVWILPRISSHNNYVDILGHMGIIGLTLFVWLAAAIARVGLGLKRRALSGFAAGYVNGMLAVGAGSLAIMLLADWLLPFVYNIGFPGFQASVLVWLFLGGLLALAAMQYQGQEERGPQ